MEAVMGSSSSSPYLKLVSCRDKTKGMSFLCLKDGKSLLKSPLHHSCFNPKNKQVDFNLSISVSSTNRGVRPVSLSCSQTQAEVENNGLLIEHTPNGYTMDEKPEARTVAVGRVIPDYLDRAPRFSGSACFVSAVGRVIPDYLDRAPRFSGSACFVSAKECSFGQNFLIVGDDPMFGLWDPMNAIPLTWSDGHLWTVDLDVPIGKCIKFKFIIQESNGEFMWQPGPDRILECSETANIITLLEDWENPDSRRVMEVDPTKVEEPAATEEMVAANERISAQLMDAISSTGIQTTKESGYAINMEDVLVSDQGVPVLVPGLSHLPTMETDEEGLVHEAPKDEAESVNGAVMASTGGDMAKDLKLPELDSKENPNTSNSNPRPAISSSIHENQDSCKNEQQVGEQQDHEATQSMKGLLLNDIQWGNNVMQKLLSIFGIQ